MNTHYSNDTAMDLIKALQQQIEALREANEDLRATNDRLQGEVYMERINRHNEVTSVHNAHIATLEFINSKLKMNV